MFPVMLILLLIYLAISDNVGVLNVVLGLLLAGAIALLIRPQARRPDWRRLPGAVLALGRYLLVLAWDLVAGGVQVARLAFSRKPDLAPGVVAIPTDCRSELSQALSMHAITLTPGEMVIAVDDDGVFYTHVLDVSVADEQVADAQWLRQELLQKIFA